MARTTAVGSSTASCISTATVTAETVRSRPPAMTPQQEDDVEEEPADDVEESPMRDGRNENSLAYLCQRFCEMYRNHSDPINIDLAAKELGIQRRRMYEILNIIQSVGLVGRLRASFYRWEGYDKMAVTLERLKDAGMVRLSSSRGAMAAPAPSPEGQRRKAVATALGERFVQIFLCNEVPQPIILEDIMGLFASCVGSGAAALTNQTSCARRLYDIANVFCSIGLVRKSCSPATDNRRKKRLYVWIGPVLPATTTPLRPQRGSALVAPSASPGSSSAKRAKRETGEPLLRKKSRLSLEASILKAERDAQPEEGEESNQREEEEKPQQLKGATPTRKDRVLQHPAVTALRTGTSSRAMLVARSLEPPPKPPSSLFNPTNSKDTSLCLLPEVPSVKRSTSMAMPVAARAVACSCSSTSTESTVLLKAQIEQLKKELQDAKTREQELLKRIDMQDAQINKLIDVKIAPRSSSGSSPATFLLNAGSSPLTNLAFSPFPGSLTRDAFASLTASPSPFSASLSTGLPGSAGRPSGRRPPFARKVRIGPNVVDPSATDDDVNAGLTPHTTSLASTLLMSPLAISALSSEKENHGIVGSPIHVKGESTANAPSTPPCNLLATAASSLLSLTPSQATLLSPSITQMLTAEALCSDLDNDTQTAACEEEARANAASPEPGAVRTRASHGAPSSPSPSAKGARAIALRHGLSRHTKTPPSPLQLPLSSSASSPPTSAFTLVESPTQPQKLST